MLGLKLRQEFEGRRLRGTAIELSNATATGATQVSALDFLRITYPTRDVVQAIEAVGPDQGRPVVLIGERGQGKSHIMGVLHHAFSDPAATAAWLAEWSSRLGDERLARLPGRSGMHVISESLHKQRYRFLWDLLFDRHPRGEYVRGAWERRGDKKSDVPQYDDLLEIFRHTPTALILDEFQTWYDGLTNTKQYPWRQWAFNFIQLLSEIVGEHRDLLVLVVSVRNGDTEAFRQIQRVGPMLVDFKGPNARRDRQRLLLHRLFENRAQVPEERIEVAVRTHVSEHLRLADVPPAEHDRVRREFVEAWPFAPHLLQLLEDQVLIATQAQETRDLIRILADLYKRRGDSVPILTAADFRIDDDESGIVGLIDSVASQHHAALREKAQRNMSAVREAVRDPTQAVPHLEEIVSALWLRSVAVENLAGAEPADLQVDVTRDRAIDDNAFQVELSLIQEHGFNIHTLGSRLVFREDENAHAKLMASARNDRLFQDGSDVSQLMRELRYVIGGEENTLAFFKVIVLPPAWLTDPWSTLDDPDQPDGWDDRIPLLVLPDPPDPLPVQLGGWLQRHLTRRRNGVRFLVPRDGSGPLFGDRDLLVLGRAVLLAEAWRAQSPEYRRLHSKYERELRDLLRTRYDRFAVLDTWSFQEPERCTFHVVSHDGQGAKIPGAVDEQIRRHLFVPEDFDAVVRAAADESESVGRILRVLQEPRPNGEHCVPWLGETSLKERILRLCARGEIAINVRGMEYLQRRAGEDEESAWRRIRGKLGTGKHLDETYVLPRQAEPQTGDVAPPPPNSLFPSGGDLQSSAGSQPCSSGPGDGAQQPAARSIFDPPRALVPCSSPPTSPLNLLAKVKDTWTIGTGTQVRDLTLKTGSLTGAQLEKLLKGLPDGVTYELSLNKEEQ